MTSKLIKLTEREKMIAFNILKNHAENVTSYYVTLFNFFKGKRFKCTPDTIFKIANKILYEEEN